MDETYIRISRDIAESWLWKDKPYSKGQALMDMLVTADEDGQLAATEQYLMDRWGWSKSKLRLFFSKLEDELIINRRKDQKKTVISIVNYSVYIGVADQKKTEQKTKKEPITDSEAIITENTEKNAMASQANLFVNMINASE